MTVLVQPGPYVLGGATPGAPMVGMTWRGVGLAGGDQSALAITADESSSYFNTLEGLDVYVVSSSNDNGSASDSMYGIRVQAKLTGSGTRTHVIGWKVNAPVNTQGVAILQVFGGYVADQTTNFTPSDGSGLHFEGGNRLSGLSFSNASGSGISYRMYGVTNGLAIEANSLIVTNPNTPLAPQASQAFKVASSVAAATGNAHGIVSAPTLTATADNDNLLAMYSVATFADGGHLNVNHWGLWVQNGKTKLQDQLVITANGMDVTGAAGIHGTLTIDTSGHLTITNVPANANAVNVGYVSAAAQPWLNLGPNVLTATTVGAAGGASALPATPSGYLPINVNGTTFKQPYYAN